MSKRRRTERRHADDDRMKDEAERKDRGKAADNDEFDSRSIQSPKELFVTRHRLLAAGRASRQPSRPDI